MRLFLFPVTLLFVSIFESSQAFGQKPDNPRISIQYKGPVGRTKVVGFLNNDARIFACGQNKVVDLFDIEQGKAVYGNPIRWEFARGTNGDIFCAAYHPPRDTFFIAGWSARGTRDIILANASSHQTLSVLPNRPESMAHGRTSIHFVAVSQDGKLAASSDEDGGIWLWDLSAGPDAATEHLVRERQQFRRFFSPLAFIDNTTLLHSSPTNGTGTQHTLVQFNVATRSVVRNFPEVYANAVTAIAVSQDQSTIVTAEFGPRMYVRAGLNSPAQKIDLAGVEAIRNVTLSPDGSLIAVMGDFAGRQQSFLWLISRDSMKILDQAVFNEKESCTTAAFDSAGNQLLSHDNSRETLLLWPLKSPDGRLLSQPLSKGDPLEIRGRGRQFKTARFLRDVSSKGVGYQISLRDIDDKQLSLIPSDSLIKDETEPNLQINSRETFSGGWTVKTYPANSAQQKFELISPNSRVHYFNFDASQDELNGVHCFIPDANGRAVAIAMGAKGTSGIYVYPLNGLLPVNDGIATLLRYLRDHNGEIIDLSVSTDGRFLASTSRDKTTKLWSLNGLLKPNRESIYGAALKLDEDQLVTAENVMPEGILYARGVREGDKILRYEFMDRQNNLITIDEPRTLLQRLNSVHIPFSEMAIWIKRLGTTYRLGGDDDRILIVPGWEPLATLVVDRHDEWVIFTPEGYFDASAAEGQFLFGWQINQGRGKTPIFEPASHLQKVYERPGIINRILSAGNVPDALAANERPVPAADGTVNLRTTLRSNIQDLPQIEIQSPNDGQQFETNQVIDVVAKVTIPPSLKASKYTVKATNGGRHIASEPQDAATKIFRWQTTVTDAITTLSVAAVETGADIVNNRHSERSVHLRTLPDPNRKSGQLFYLGIAAEEYKHMKKLQYTIDGVESIADVLKQHPSLTRYMGNENIRLLIEDAVTRNAIYSEANRLVADVNKRNNPEDLIIVNVSGHGVRHNDTFYFVPPAVEDQNTADLTNNGVPWQLLCDSVAKAKCHVLWIVDACHAGASSKYGIREVLGGNKPGRRVIWAATEKQEALEDTLAKVRVGDKGNGWATMAFIETLIKNEVSADKEIVSQKVDQMFADGSLDLQEIAKYVKDRVVEKTDENQKPVFAPLPTHAVDIKLLSRQNSDNSH